MYLSSHFSASFDVWFFSVKSPEKRTSEDYNFLLVQNGTITIEDDKEQYILSQGDIYLLEPDHTYQLDCLSDNFCLNIQYSKSFIDRLIPHDSVLICNSTIGRKSDYQELAQVLADIAMAYPTDNSENQLLSLLFHFMDVLQRNHIHLLQKDTDDIAAKRINEIQTYIQHNFHLPLSLQELAEQMYLSPQYLSKFIKQNMGITFIHYLNNVRMEHAYEELINTDHSVTEIAFNNGFSNTAAFNKSFREQYQESPSAHRLRKKAELGKEIRPADSHIKKVTSKTDTQDNAEPICIFTDQHSPYYPSWSDTINIGSLTNALFISFHDVFLRCQHFNHFRYVRFDNLFSEEIIRPLKGGLGFDYTNLNMIFDFFAEAHAIPFIELSYKPRKNDLVNYRDKDAKKLFQNEKAPEYYYNALDNFLRHCLNRYGYETVSQWRFEIWMKHDESLNYISTPKEYIEKFRTYRDIIKKLLPECRVGGPGYNTSADKLTFIETLEEMKRQQIYPDFFSIYIYCHAPERYDSRGSADGTHTILSTDPDMPLKQYRSYLNSIREIIPGEIPLYITEFNSGLFGTNYVSASAFQAAFICKSVLDLFKETSCIAYWHFSDMVRQFTESPQEYSTDTGLIDSHGIPKAPMFTYIFLGKLKKQLIAHGENYIVTTNGSNQYQLLAYNYVHYNRYYCMNYLTRLSISHTYDVFEEGAPKKMTFCLTNLHPGRYKVTKNTLNRKHGSLLDKFIRIFNKGYLTPEELNYMILNMQEEETDYYIHTVRPKQDIRYVGTDENNSLNFSFTMKPHEVVLFEFTRKI